MVATGGFVFKKNRGKRAKLKKIGANEELSSKTEVVAQLAQTINTFYIYL
jgi:hypothetical protein